MTPKLSIQIIRSKGVNLFLPEGYPKSVRGLYKQFFMWNWLQMTFSSALGVLSTQQLLLALGVHSISSSAVLNWILKDGLGQLGGIVYAGVVGSRFDIDVKYYRWVSSTMITLAGALEMMAPMFPSYFLLIASLSTTGKNISYLSASASKAAINLSFCNAHNLADVTAKNGTQTTAACLGGMGLGMGLAYICPVYSHSVFAFTFCASASLVCTWAELKYVTLRHLNVERGEYVFRHFFEHGRILMPEEVAKNEHITTKKTVLGLRLCEVPSDLEARILTTHQPYIKSYVVFPVESEVFLLYSETCSDLDMLKGFYTAISMLWKGKFKREIELEKLVPELQAAGWDLTRFNLEPREARYKLGTKE